MHADFVQKEALSSANCPICGELNTSNGPVVFDDRYGHPGSFKLAECKRCAHLMTLPQLTEKDLPHLYGTYYPRKNLTPESVLIQANTIQSRFSALKRWLLGIDNQGQYTARVGEKVLDIGCGSGASLLEAQILGADAYGVEADPNVQSLAKALNLRIHQGSLEDGPFPEMAFDLIILNQVIEHIPAPDRALSLVFDRLSKNGRVVLVFPNRDSFWCRVSGKNWINWHIPYHLHHFNAKGFEQLANQCGFEVVRSRTITPNLWTILQWRANRYSASQGTPNPIWSVGSTEKLEKNLASRSGLSLRRVLLGFALAVIAVFNRGIDCIGWGDSLMVEIKRTRTQ
jgi:SAM-dependent methyltransferase